MIRRPPRSTQSRSSAASDVYKRQMWYHVLMAMTLRLSDEQTEALRRKAEAEHRSMQQVAQAAIDAYVHQPTTLRRQSVPVAELTTLFGDLPPMNAAEFR